VERYQTPVAAAALLVRDGKLLLGRRAAHRRSFARCWDTIGGHLEAGENHEEALTREIEEELGVRPTQFRLLGDYQAQAGSWFRLFKVEAWSGGEPRIANDEHSELRWFTAEEASCLPELASAHYPAIFRGLDLRVGDTEGDFGR
jgi:8-oxo-dGTP diphosphatase